MNQLRHLDCAQTDTNLNPGIFRWGYLFQLSFNGIGNLQGFNKISDGFLGNLFVVPLITGVFIHSKGISSTISGWRL